MVVVWIVSMVAVWILLRRVLRLFLFLKRFFFFFSEYGGCLDSVEKSIEVASILKKVFCLFFFVYFFF